MATEVQNCDITHFTKNLMEVVKFYKNLCEISGIS